MRSRGLENQAALRTGYVGRAGSQPRRIGAAKATPYVLLRSARTDSGTLVERACPFSSCVTHADVIEPVATTSEPRRSVHAYLIDRRPIFSTAMCTSTSSSNFSGALKSHVA